MDRPTTTEPSQHGRPIRRPVGLQSALAAVAVPRLSRSQMLRGAEYIVGIVTLVFWAWWFVDGYGRDLMHDWRAEQSQAVMGVPVVGLATVTTTPALGDSLPVSVIATHATSAEGQQSTQPAQVVDPRPTRLSIPSIGLDSTVMEVFLSGGAWQVADYAVGYHHGTGLPGTGNVVLAGHKGQRGSVFAQLESLHSGADIWIDAGNQRFHYQVSATGKVMPDQVSIMQPSSEPIVTLITCTNWDTERFVAVAKLVDVVPATAGVTTELIYGHGER